MSKRRRTRAQKERASLRRNQNRGGAKKVLRQESKPKQANSKIKSSSISRVVHESTTKGNLRKRDLSKSLALLLGLVTFNLLVWFLINVGGLKGKILELIRV